MIDPISDMLARIKNAIKARHEKVAVPYSNFKKEILNILKSEGYISDFETEKKGKLDVLIITLAYDNGASKITDLQKISKSSRRIYIDKNNIPKSKQGYGIMVISTSKGLMSDKQARKQGVGGELLCEVW